MAKINVYNYNNFFNRIVKTENTLSDYGTPVYSIANCNFDSGDNVYTSITLGNNQYNSDGNYVLVLDDEDNIISKWFIIDQKRTRRGQYVANLKRDLLVEYYNNIINAPCFINKAMVPDNNPLIFNSEGNNYNQIKKQEILLKDKSETPWIVGYISKKDDSLITTNMNIAVSKNSSNVWEGSISSPFSIIEEVVVKDRDQYDNEWTNTLSPGRDNLGVGYELSNGTLYFGCRSIPFNAQYNTSLTSTTINSITITGQSSAGTYIKFDYQLEEPTYIDASQLPWNFDPTDTGLGGIAPNTTIQVNGINYCKEGYVTRAYTTLSKDNNGNYKTSYTTDITTQIDSYDSNQHTNMYPLYGSFSINSTYVYYYKYAINEILSNSGKITPSDIVEIMAKLGIKGYTSDPEPYNNKIIKYNGAYYKIQVGSATTSTQVSFEFDSDSSQDYSLYTKWQNTLIAIKDYWNNHNSSVGTMYYHVADGTVPGTSLPVYGNNFGGSLSTVTYPLTITRYYPETKSAGFWISGPGKRNSTADAPYDVFAIPYNKVHMQVCNRDTDKLITDDVINALSASLGSRLYDLQILPYCPLLDVPVSAGVIKEIGSRYTDYDYIVNASDQKVGIIYFCSQAKGTFDIPVNLEIENYTQKANINKKIDSETVNYRLVSPNYNGQFEFKVSYNNANISSINVDFEYKPYTPYIHVCPVWNSNGLYGGDYDDARGLICGGDFSLPIINDAWTQYQIQNKNYQTIFDRQIQNMRQVQEQRGWDLDNQAILGTFTGALGGAAAGAKVGGGWGAAIGAVVGMGTGLAGGLLDSYSQQKYYNIEESYTKDMFQLQLGNIKALPYSLTKVSSLNNNNKFFPFIEKYEATDTEVTALINKITYTSMNVGVVGKISDYIVSGERTWISGNILIMENLGEDSLTAGTIYEEIKKGVYI